MRDGLRAVDSKDKQEHRGRWEALGRGCGACRKLHPERPGRDGGAVSRGKWKGVGHGPSVE